MVKIARVIAAAVEAVDTATDPVSDRLSSLRTKVQAERVFVAHKRQQRKLEREAEKLAKEALLQQEVERLEALKAQAMRGELIVDRDEDSVAS